MTLSANQPKRGTLRGESGPNVSKTGRDSGFGPGQSKRGNLHGESGPDNGKATRPVPTETQSSRGTHGIAGGDGAGSVQPMPQNMITEFVEHANDRD